MRFRRRTPGAPAVDRRMPSVPARTRTARAPRPTWRRVLSAALWTVVAVCGAAYAASLLVPLWYQVNDERLLIVTSGSMAPKFEAGDAVVLQAITRESDLKVGQVVSFWPVGSQQLVTHRIVALRHLPELTDDPETGERVPKIGADGAPLTKPYVFTKGDANAEADPNAIPITRVRGVVLDVHRGWGWVLQWSTSASGRAVMLVPPLLSLATLELLAVADGRRERRAAAASAQADARRFDDLLLD